MLGGGSLIMVTAVTVCNYGLCQPKFDSTLKLLFQTPKQQYNLIILMSHHSSSTLYECNILVVTAKKLTLLNSPQSNLASPGLCGLPEAEITQMK